MSDPCQSCCATDVAVPDDFAYGSLLYPTQGFSFVLDCPAGYVCQPGLFPYVEPVDKSDIPPVLIPPVRGTSFIVRLQGCQSMIFGTIPANATAAQIRAVANSMQRQWANQQAICNVISIFSLRPRVRTIVLPGGCKNVSYGVGSRPFGGSGPYDLTFTGALPPGLVATQITGTAFQLAGSPTEPGTYTFTVVTGTAQVNYQVSILGLTNSPDPGSKGVAYSFDFTVAGGSGTYVFALASGTLPAGLTLSAAGTLSGTPTAAGSSSFTVRVHDSVSGLTCICPAAITVIDPCNCSTDWAAAPGTCRLRIVGYFDGMFTPCIGSTPSASPAWDGTLPNFILGVPEFTANPVPYSIGGKIFNGATLPSGTPGVDHIAIFGDIGGGGVTIWEGTPNQACVIGTFTRIPGVGGGCSAGPASITVEAYTP